MARNIARRYTDYPKRYFDVLDFFSGGGTHFSLEGPKNEMAAGRQDYYRFFSRMREMLLEQTEAVLNGEEIKGGVDPFLQEYVNTINDISIGMENLGNGQARLHFRINPIVAALRRKDEEKNDT